MRSYIVLIASNCKTGGLANTIRHSVKAKDFVDALAMGKAYIAEHQKTQHGEKWKDAEVIKIFERVWQK